MLNLRLVIENPWSKAQWADRWNWTRQITKHKVLEAQLCKYNAELFGVCLNTCWRGRDHAGLELDLIAFGYTFALRFYDSRHWDYITNSWATYDGVDTCQDNQK